MHLKMIDIKATQRTALKAAWERSKASVLTSLSGGAVVGGISGASGPDRTLLHALLAAASVGVAVAVILAGVFICRFFNFRTMSPQRVILDQQGLFLSWGPDNEVTLRWDEVRAAVREDTHKWRIECRPPVFYWILDDGYASEDWKALSNTLENWERFSAAEASQKTQDESNHRA